MTQDGARGGTAGATGRPRVVVAGLGDTGMLIALRLTKVAEVVGISTRPALVSGQELGTRLVDPPRWQRTYVVPHRRFRHLDRVRTVHGRIVASDLDARTVTVEGADGTTRVEPYEVLVVATGTSNGFWRHDRVEGVDAVEALTRDAADRLAAASTVAVVGGGATGVSVADNLARRGGATVHLFHSGEQPLPGYHPRARSWIVRRLTEDGVVLHPGHRAVMPAGFTGDRLTTEPIAWSTGQPDFHADLVLWAVGGGRPHSAFLPAEVLDEDGFVRVDEHLQVPGHPEVFAIGDVAATDPNRSSARNWGWRTTVTNVRAYLRGGRMKSFTAPEYRWGSVLGVQEDGMVIVQPDGKRTRVPRAIAERYLVGAFVTRFLYRGLRPHRD
ncbi:MAG: NAD(P)/FAD-dependent oxidoreductase [Actinomycetes bacterium]